MRQAWDAVFDVTLNSSIPLTPDVIYPPLADGACEKGQWPDLEAGGDSVADLEGERRLTEPPHPSLSPTLPSMPGQFLFFPPVRHLSESVCLRWTTVHLTSPQQNGCDASCQGLMCGARVKITREHSHFTGLRGQERILGTKSQ